MGKELTGFNLVADKEPLRGVSGMYFFYLGETLLPVAPEKVSTQISNKNKTVTLINEGEINLLKAPGLTQWKFKILLPNAEYSFARYPDGYHPGGYYLDILEQLKLEKKPFQFRILRYSGKIDWKTDAKVSLEDYAIEEDAQNGFDFMVDIQLKRYREWGTKVLVIKDDTANQKPQRDPAPVKPKGKEYTIQDGDTLWGIAQRFLGDGMKYHEVYTANKKVLDDEAARRGMGSGMGERWIFTGTKILIPAG